MPRFTGTSSTGTKHELDVQYSEGDDSFKFSLLGPTGKRHGSVTLSGVFSDDLARYITGRYAEQPTETVWSQQLEAAREANPH